MMSRIIAVTLVLLILVDSTTSSPRFKSKKHPHADLLEFTSVGFTKMDILKCRCKTTTSSKMLCSRPLVPTNDIVKGDLKKCLCRQTTRCHPRIQKFCQSKCPVLQMAQLL